MGNIKKWIQLFSIPGANNFELREMMNVRDSFYTPKQASVCAFIDSRRFGRLGMQDWFRQQIERRLKGDFQSLICEDPSDHELYLHCLTQFIQLGGYLLDYLTNDMQLWFRVYNRLLDVLLPYAETLRDHDKKYPLTRYIPAALINCFESLNLSLFLSSFTTREHFAGYC